VAAALFIDISRAREALEGKRERERE